jgi:Fur family peroxide stress response transcriptional regulator
VAIYEALCHSGQHPSAEQLYSEVKRRFSNISFDTVNRTLLTFAKIGLAEFVEGFGSPRRYDADLKQHHHAHCIKCGAILDFHNPEFDDLEIPPEIEKKYKIVSKKVIINGICSKCRHQRKSDK